MEFVGLSCNMHKKLDTSFIILYYTSRAYKIKLKFIIIKMLTNKENKNSHDLPVPFFISNFDHFGH